MAAFNVHQTPDKSDKKHPWSSISPFAAVHHLRQYMHCLLGVNTVNCNSWKEGIPDGLFRFPIAVLNDDQRNLVRRVQSTLENVALYIETAALDSFLQLCFPPGTRLPAVVAIGGIWHHCPRMDLPSDTSGSLVRSHE